MTRGRETLVMESRKKNGTLEFLLVRHSGRAASNDKPLTAIASKAAVVDCGHVSLSFDTMSIVCRWVMKMEAVEIPSRMIVEFFLEMQKRYKLSTIIKRIERPMSARMEMRGLAHSMHAVGVSAATRKSGPNAWHDVGGKPLHVKPPLKHALRMSGGMKYVSVLFERSMTLRVSDQGVGRRPLIELLRKFRLRR